jgi:sodium/proline symporter
MSVVVVSFLGWITSFAVIGVWSMRHSRPTSDDYLIASRQVSPWLTALSSAATNNSGFMFIGLLGFTYRFGVQAVWLQLGWILGDVVAWIWVHRRVRERSGRLGVSSMPELVASDDQGRVARPIAAVAGIITFLFLGGYAAAQLKAGSTALSGLFGWDPAVGAVLGAIVVVVYCYAGGIRASIWTDAAQALVMLASLTALFAFAVARVGGPVALWDALTAADPALVDWVPDLRLGLPLYLLGFVAGGFGVVGQPHVMIRSMASRSAEAIAPARRVYFLWYVPFSIVAVATGLYGRVLLPDLLAGAAPDQVARAAENALPALATLLLPEILLGTLLAAVFAATMSTADSQILACSAAITHDVAPRLRTSYLAGKAATLGVAAMALAIALFASDDVFGLVLDAWSALGATLGPLLLVRIAGAPLPTGRALAMMASGLVTVTLWGRSDLSGDAFQLLPGFAVPALVYLAGAALDRARRRA